MYYSPTATMPMSHQPSYNHQQSNGSNQGCDSGGQPVRVAVVNGSHGNCDSSAPSEHVSRSTNNYNDDSNHLSFLYDRANMSPYTPAPCTTTQQNGCMGSVSPPGDQYYVRATPAPLLHQQTSTGGTAQCYSPPIPPTSSTDYHPFSRATPAPLQQNRVADPPSQLNGDHQGAPLSNSQAMSGVEQQMSNLGLSARQPPSPNPASVAAVNHQTINTHHSVPIHRQQPPTSFQSVPRSRQTAQTRTQPSFVRRQSAPGPIGGASGQAGSRKPWSYTPTFGTTGRTGPGPVSMQRPVVQPSADVCNAFYKQTSGSRGSLNSDSDSVCRYNADGSLIDNSSIRYKLREGDDIGEYEQTSIRYTGKANPSKTFQLLQTATGSDSETDAKLAQATARRQVRRRRQSRDELEDQLPQADADDIVDISYVGAKIPSRTFRILQEAIGERGFPVETPPADDVAADEGFGSSGRNVRVIHLRPMKKHSSLDNILDYTDL